MKNNIDFDISFLDEIVLDDVFNLYESVVYKYDEKKNGFLLNYPTEYLRIGNSSNYISINKMRL